MPLIRAIGRFFQHRMDVPCSSADYGDVIRAEYRGDIGGFGSASSMGIFWLVIAVITIPVVLFLALVGLIYELLIRVTGRRLPPMSDWALSLLAGVALVAGGLSWAVAR